MAIAGFEELCAGLCEIAGAAPAAVQTGDEDVLSLRAELRGTTFELLHSPAKHPAHFFLLVTLGPAATGGTDPRAVLEAMLMANFEPLGIHPPVLSLHPVTRDAVLQYACSLFDITPNALYSLIDEGVDWARDWKERLCAPVLDGTTDSSGRLPTVLPTFFA